MCARTRAWAVLDLTAPRAPMPWRAAAEPPAGKAPTAVLSPRLPPGTPGLIERSDGVPDPCDGAIFKHNNRHRREPGVALVSREA
ncbi:hypothetical protein BDS110ZK12_63810 [Bradyrhizobium diazoefficiens]|uniref:Uncharacterized protein n=1 Tax=Bradyrhizobium diazoefficiens TaxID=1355477 RepID=A0A810BK37_9BRAD|nr:hypothetical protein XF8B_58120 [Bradyrhizobium diazoefficiens]